MKKSWLLLMSFDEHDGSPNEIKTLYHNKTKKEMVKMMNLLQDMNEHLVLSLVQIDPTSTYEDIIRVDDSEMYFMDSKANWNNGKTYEELKEEAFEEMIMGSVLNGDMGFA
jgi:uncharacterized cupredoxin-like copper-binding protein|tara:strand:- start:33 stop:365 length:333 start_codon:yes stop_codon:yes gene_type:complete